MGIEGEKMDQGQEIDGKGEEQEEDDPRLRRPLPPPNQTEVEEKSQSHHRIDEHQNVHGNPIGAIERPKGAKQRKRLSLVH